MNRYSAARKRSSIRVPSGFYVKLFDSESVTSGIARNISSNGMCINTGICSPLNAGIELIIPVRNGKIELHARVKWNIKTYDFYDIMGVEIIEPSVQYLQMVGKLKNACLSTNTHPPVKL